MAKNTCAFDVGGARVTALKFADLTLTPAESLKAPPGEEAELAASIYRLPVRVSAQSFHISFQGLSLLVDPGRYDPAEDPDGTAAGYTPPPDLPASLAAAGIDRRAITHVVITHGHWDHINGTTIEQNGALEPLCPNARHLIGAGDWEAAQALLADPGSLESRTLGILGQRGLIDPVTDTLDIAGAVRVLPTPGETPGHQVVRLAFRGEVAYVLGDLFHLALEVEHPTWMPEWIFDRALKLRSRKEVLVQAVKNGALLLAAHIPSAGRLHPLGAGYFWQSAFSLWE